MTTYNDNQDISHPYEGEYSEKPDIDPDYSFPSDYGLQDALLQAAKIGNISLMLKFADRGANPYICDAEDRNALSYAIASNPAQADFLLRELNKRLIDKRKKEDSNEVRKSTAVVTFIPYDL